MLRHHFKTHMYTYIYHLPAGFIYAHANNATYEPELFPGLVYRMIDPKLCVLVFVSGKLVITGAKNAESLGRAIENIYPHLLEFRKKNMVISKVSNGGNSNNNIISNSSSAGGIS